MKRYGYALPITAVLIANLAACANFEANSTLKQQTTDDLRARIAQNEQKRPVVTSTTGAWLAGPSIKLEEPMHPALRQLIGYHPTYAVGLAEVAAWVTQSSGIPVDISELQVPTTATGQPGQLQGQPIPMQPNQGYATTQGQYGQYGTGAPRESMWAMHINYEGTRAGLLDIAANKSGAWWRMANGRVIFYRTLTRTFFLPAIARKFTANSSITTTSGSTNTAATDGNNQASMASSGGITANSIYAVDIWGDLEKAAAKVAPGAQIAVNPSARSITVTGSPAQIRQVEEWAKSQTDQLIQQVEITVRTFSVRIDHADNYSWNPSVIFKSTAGVLGATLTGAQSPTIASGMAAGQLGLSIGGNGPFDGTTAALQALSTLGEVVETSKQTAVTTNGQPVLLQSANTQGYIASASTTTTTNAGTTTSLNQDSVTAGTTWVFLPQVANGKVVLGMNLTRSVNNGFKPWTSGGMMVQTKNVTSDSTQQSVSLTPGDALVLSTLSQESGSTNKSGTGSPSNPVLGGGFANLRGQVLTGTVISVRIL